MCGRLGVFPHEATNSDVLPVGDLLMVSTSNGQNEGHTRVASPRAPSLIAVDKGSGEVVWRAIGAGEQVLHGQWSSPVAANVHGRMQVLFGGGDGGCVPTTRRRVTKSGVLTAIRRTPAGFRAPESCRAVLSSLHRSSPTAWSSLRWDRVLGTATDLHLFMRSVRTARETSPRAGSVWTSREVGRVVGTPIAKDGLLYVGDVGGTVHCLDAATGAHVWKHETNGAIWGCLLLAGDRLYVGNEDGTMTILRAGRRKQLLAQIEMDAPLYSPPALIGDALYLATANRLYLIAGNVPENALRAYSVSTPLPGSTNSYFCGRTVVRFETRPRRGRLSRPARRRVESRIRAPGQELE